MVLIPQLSQELHRPVFTDQRNSDIRVWDFIYSASVRLAQTGIGQNLVKMYQYSYCHLVTCTL